jgi:hypothetical protein
LLFPSTWKNMNSSILPLRPQSLWSNCSHAIGFPRKSQLPLPWDTSCVFKVSVSPGSVVLLLSPPDLLLHKGWLIYSFNKYS